MKNHLPTSQIIDVQSPLHQKLRTALERTIRRTGQNQRGFSEAIGLHPTAISNCFAKGGTPARWRDIAWRVKKFLAEKS
jgi:hypothetical protein